MSECRGNRCLNAVEIDGCLSARKMDRCLSAGEMYSCLSVGKCIGLFACIWDKCVYFIAAGNTGSETLCSLCLHAHAQKHALYI